MEQNQNNKTYKSGFLAFWASGVARSTRNQKLFPFGNVLQPVGFYDPTSGRSHFGSRPCGLGHGIRGHGPGLLAGPVLKTWTPSSVLSAQPAAPWYGACLAPEILLVYFFAYFHDMYPLTFPSTPSPASSPQAGTLRASLRRSSWCTSSTTSSTRTPLPSFKHHLRHPQTPCTSASLA